MTKRMPSFSNLNRKKLLEQAENTHFDLIVIGGGITGAAILMDAALRGIRAVLVEKNDFSSGTSSKSTKLIHGGLRYLKQLELGLVRETGTERAVAHRNICHLVHPEHMILPIMEGGTFSQFSANIAISVYDFLAKVPSEDRKKKLSQKAMLEMEPLLNKNKVKSGIQYSEYRTDDARLTIELIKAAVRNGNMAFNYLEAKELGKKNEKITSVVCLDNTTKEQLSIQAKHVVNATGPWFDNTRKLDARSTEDGLLLSKGSHIVFDHSTLPINNSIYFDAPDGRMIFAIPRGESVYVGTTDTRFEARMEDVRCNKADADYLLNAVNSYFNIQPLNISDIVSTWAGIRPLIRQKGKAPTEISRKDEIFISDSGLISIAGGKLTGFRKMAERTVDIVAKKLELRNAECKTLHYKIHENPFEDYKAYVTMLNAVANTYEGRYTKAELTELVNNFGKDAEAIIETALSSFDGNLFYSALDYCLHHEGIYHPMDFLERRTGWLYFSIKKAKESFKETIEYLSEKFGWNLEQRNAFSEEIKKRIEITSLSDLKQLD